MYYQVSLDEELKQVNKAVDYYLQQAATIADSKEIYSQSLTHYYRKLIRASESVLRFRAVFFAMRLQPVLTYVSQFVDTHHRAPNILDLGCRFGLETILIGRSGACVHGIDPERNAILEAAVLKTHYEKQERVELDVRYEKANLFSFNPPETYDAIYSSATMHHIEPMGQAMPLVAKLIKPGGYFFLSDENGLSPAQQLIVQKRIGWMRSRKLWLTDSETGQPFLYGNENIRPPFRWAHLMKQAGLQPVSLKYCRFLPPIDWSVERLVKFERVCRNIPLITQLNAIGFLMIARQSG